MDAVTWQCHPSHLPMAPSHTIQNQHLPQAIDMTHCFPSTHWCSLNQSHLVGLSHIHHPATLANNHTWDQTMMSHIENQAAGFQALESMSTGQNHALNLEGSPSWNSVTAQMQMQEFDHFYPVQQERLHA
ncbi:hypothetical protein DFH29DRAFT_905703 [Suillus ampliporus]|nr:hypothetical protein DFH29DRAFT_905703 [Suillus ampliporus]